MAWPRDSIVSLVISSPLDGPGAPNLLLQQQNAVQQRLGGGRAARNINVHRHDAVAAAYHRVGIMVIAPAISARAHGHPQTPLRYSLVDLPHPLRHLLVQR